MTKDWRQEAFCRNADTEIFFPTPVHGKEPDYSRAEPYCRVCPVRTECKEAAKREPFGYWASTPEERGFKGQEAQRKAAIAFDATSDDSWRTMNLFDTEEEGATP